MRKTLPEYGPAMLALNLRHRRFVVMLFDRPGIPAVTALKLAGYKGKDASAQKQSYRLMHNPDVMAAIKEYAAVADTHQIPAATGAYRDILNNPKSRDRLTAAKHVMERAGLGPSRESHVTVTHQFDRNDLLSKIAGLLERNTPALIPAPPRPLITNGSTARWRACDASDGGTVTVESEAEQSSFVGKGEATETE
jgi:hypothetical protein